MWDVTSGCPLSGDRSRRSSLRRLGVAGIAWEGVPRSGGPGCPGRLWPQVGCGSTLGGSEPSGNPRIAAINASNRFAPFIDPSAGVRFSAWMGRFLFTPHPLEPWTLNVDAASAVCPGTARDLLLKCSQSGEPLAACSCSTRNPSVVNANHDEVRTMHSEDQYNLVRLDLKQV